MISSVSVTNVLEALGAVEWKVIDTSDNWNFYQVIYRTPGGDLRASYLSLAQYCPRIEASSSNLNRWRRLADGQRYDVIVDSSSPLSRGLLATARDFHGRDATTLRNLLFENVVRKFMPAANDLEELEYFIEPDVILPNGEVTRSLSHILNGLRSVQKDRARSTPRGGRAEVRAASDPSAMILVAPAGLGKTTLCREISRRLLAPGYQIIPIFVELTQWQNLINLTLPNILNAALLQLIPEAGSLTHPKLFQLLVREKLLVPIFDGFDELCLHPNSDYSPANLISELLELIGESGARILITVRETFWNKYELTVPPGSVERVNLMGFSNDQRQRFFEKRLTDTAERDIANRLSREIGGRLYEAHLKQQPLQADRASGIPLLLELIALYVDGNAQATFAPVSQDPLGNLLEAVCERENIRQRLRINADRQMEIFEDLFRDYSDEVLRSDLAVYVQYHVPDITADTLARFESHAFFSPGHDVRPRFEMLRVYFIARWLANKLEATAEGNFDQPLTQILERNANGNSEVFDYLVERFQLMEPSKVIAAISHAARMIRARPHWEGACSALFQLAQRLAHSKEADNRVDRSKALSEYLGLSAPKFTKWSVQGQISRLSLAGFSFDSCTFRNVEFRSCTFDEATEFRNTQFQGNLVFENCEGPGKAKLVQCNLSDTAERAWDIQAGRSSRRIINEGVAREAMRDVLRRFQGPFGFTSVKEVDKNSGSIMRNPCRDTAWEELIRSSVTDRHTISGVTGGGLHVSEADGIRHEVRSFLDNAALGPHLSRALEQILRRI